MNGYLTEEENLNIAGFTIKLLRIVNVDDLYEKLILKGNDHEDVRDERIPYWADLWPSAVALGKHLLKSKINFENLVVHEMGCGLGLPGIVAGKRGAKMIFTDYLQEALDFAKQNWKLNCRADADFRIMDWRKPDPYLNADLLIASDVAYEKKSFEYLLKAFDVLTRTGGKILVSEPSRLYAQSFFEMLPFSGFTVEKFIYPVTRNNIDHRINIFEITSSLNGKSKG